MMTDEGTEQLGDMDTSDGDEKNTQSELQMASLTEPKTADSLGLWQRLYNRRGLICVLLASFSYALENVLFRGVEKEMHPTEVLFFTYLLKSFCVLPIIAYKGYSPRPASKVTYIFLIGRGLIGMIAFNCLILAMRYMNLGDATAIAISSPVLVGIFARIFLKEPIGIIDVFLTLAVVAGVFIISKPSFLFGGTGNNASSNLIGATLASCACIFYALVNIFNRKLGLSQINSFVNVLYYNIMGFIGTGVIGSIFGIQSLPPCGYDRVIIVTMGIVGCAGSCLDAYSFTIEKSLPLVIIKTNEVVFAYLLEFLLFDIKPDLIVLLGVCLVVSASLTALIRKRKQT